ncbi:uncharacterized protein PFL1_01048 [Pseudozyma flocculosa PF-1]|uniref:uncharacterized protein n=1 Tax=Pseudozyma flocculosa PF-1 TaxID=1277687 RepID=UPI00045608B7|nr:uncharacterized protein PFL1_01048 [Pseudozyma flocculosa PF-1]EPQ31715.1 hypothetical protein PFL1_01048 [Pseudozyma flocculosa PF-1]
MLEHTCVRRGFRAWPARRLDAAQRAYSGCRLAPAPACLGQARSQRRGTETPRREATSRSTWWQPRPVPGRLEVYGPPSQWPRGAGHDETSQGERRGIQTLPWMDLRGCA